MIGKHFNPEHDLLDGMYVVVTGSGSALPDPARGNANAAVIVDGYVLQFDCGRGALEGLQQVGVNPLDVDYLFLTHLHFDHIATYGYYVVASWIGGRQAPLLVYGPPGTASMSHHTVAAHAVDVEFVNCLLDVWPAELEERPVRDMPLAVTEFSSRGIVLDHKEFRVSAVETPHYREMGVISFGYRVDSEHGSVVISGDGRTSNDMVAFAKNADVIVHECTKPDPGMLSTGKFSQANEGYDERSSQPSGGHTTPTWLGRLARDARVGTVIATHLPPLTALPAAVEMSHIYTGSERFGPEIWSAVEAGIRKSFDGTVLIGEDGLMLRVARRV